MAKRVHELKANNNNIHGHLGMDSVIFFFYFLLLNQKRAEYFRIFLALK